MPDWAIYLFIGTMVVVKLIDLITAQLPPDTCLSCGHQFDESKVNLFCHIGEKEVRFCDGCTGRPIGRLGTNHDAFIEKGFSPEEIKELDNLIYMYKN